MSAAEAQLAALPRLSSAAADDGRGCRWPMWATGTRPTGRFCGAVRATETRLPYCPDHRFVAIRKPRADSEEGAAD